MAKNNPIITRMPREVKGELFDLNIMPAGSGQLEKKRGMNIQKYGGYNKLTGSYYFVAEYLEKSKRVRSIETVYLYAEKLYRDDPIKYCMDILHLQAPRIVCREIRADALLEMDGSRLYISGRTGNYYVCEHAYQLAIDPSREKYIRDLQKYVDRCTAKRAELPVTERDGVTAEKNVDMYDFFVEKLRTKTYQKLLENMQKDLYKSKSVFENKTLFEQAKLLLEILKAFRCNAQNANLTELNGKGTVGRVCVAKKISSSKNAYLIHQSVTGLYEVREDLLN